MAAYRYEFYFLMAKTIFYSLAVLVCKILFCHSKIKFLSSHHRVISSMYTLGQTFKQKDRKNEIMIIKLLVD